jgi:hypothetical protein
MVSKGLWRKSVKVDAAIDSRVDDKMPVEFVTNLRDQGANVRAVGGGIMCALWGWHVSGITHH